MIGIRAEFYLEVPDGFSEENIFAYLKELASKNKGELIKWS